MKRKQISTVGAVTLTLAQKIIIEDTEKMPATEGITKDEAKVIQYMSSLAK